VRYFLEQGDEVATQVQKNIRRAMRRRFSAEGKICIVFLYFQ
jgi:hypothetical protein